MVKKSYITPIVETSLSEVPDYNICVTYVSGSTDWLICKYNCIVRNRLYSASNETEVFDQLIEVEQLVYKQRGH